MRLGCLGCLTSILLVVAGIAMIGGASLAVIRGSKAPEVALAAGTAADGARAQQKLYEISRGGRARGSREIALTERELNAFLSRHLASASGMPLRVAGVRLVGADVAEFLGQVPLASLVGEPPLRALTDLLPAAWLDRPVWIHIRTRASIERGAGAAGRRYLRLDVERSAVGRQRVPALLLRQLLDPTALAMLRWPLPDGVDAVTIERGRAVIRLASGR